MTVNEPKTITAAQAKHQIGLFGRSLILYILFFGVFHYGIEAIHTDFPTIFFGLDPDYVQLVAYTITALLMVLFFHLSSVQLKLNIKDYLKKTNMSFFKWVSLLCIGIGIALLMSSIATLFYFFTSSNRIRYPYLGAFNTTDNIIKNILYFLFFVLLRPICDEYIFRGIIQRKLGHFGRYFGVLGSAMLYAIAQFDFMHAFSSFFVGWYLSLVTLKYHSIRPTIQISIGISLFLWIVDIVPAHYFWIVLIFLLIVYLIAAISFVSRFISTNMVRYGATEWKLWKLLLTTPSIILCILLFVANVVLSFFL